MTDGPQEILRRLLIERGRVDSREIIRMGFTWDHRRIISRLRQQGMHIDTEMPKGQKWATYVYRERWEQEPLF